MRYIQHSDGQEHTITFISKDSWESDYFKDEFIPLQIDSEQTYHRLWKKGLYIYNDRLELPDAELGLIKFLYWNEGEPRVLMEQENIAVAWDGERGASGVSLSISPSSHIFSTDSGGKCNGESVDINISCTQSNAYTSGASLRTRIDRIAFNPSSEGMAAVIGGIDISGGESTFRIDNSFKVMTVSGYYIPTVCTMAVYLTYIDLEDNEVGGNVLTVSLGTMATGMYLGSMEEFPSDRESGRLANNYFLYSGTESKYITYTNDFGQQVTTLFKPGVMYIWTGARWEVDKTDSHYMSSLGDAVNLAEKIDETSDNFIAVYKNLTTSILTVGKMFARNITMGDGGLFKSENYCGTNEWGTPVNTNGYNHKGYHLALNGYQEAKKNGTESEPGWAFDYNGLADFYGLHAENITATGGTFTNVTVSGNSYFGGRIIAGNGWLEHTVEGTYDGYDALCAAVKTGVGWTSGSYFKGIAVGGFHGTQLNKPDSDLALYTAQWNGAYLLFIMSGIEIDRYGNVTFYGVGELKISYFNSPDGDWKTAIRTTPLNKFNKESAEMKYQPDPERGNLRWLERFNVSFRC